jgi:tRNA(Ile)-lysidine synthase
VVAIAHHIDDSIETFFINLLRGTGLRGLTGITTHAGKLIRPLMFASRKDILEYAVAQHIPYREDSSNRSTKYLRNKIRLGLVPRIKEISPKFTDLMRQNIGRLTDAQLFINHGIQRIREEVITTENGIDTIHIDRIDRAFPLNFVIFELLNSTYSFKGDVSDALVRALEQNSGTGKRFYSKSHVAYIDRGRIMVTPIPADDPCQVQVEAGAPRQLGALLRAARHRRYPGLRRTRTHRPGGCRQTQIPAHGAPLAGGGLVHSLRHVRPQEGQRLPDRP